jgi:hypothetical protein
MQFQVCPQLHVSRQSAFVKEVASQKSHQRGHLPRVEEAGDAGQQRHLHLAVVVAAHGVGQLLRTRALR